MCGERGKVGTSRADWMVLIVLAAAKLALLLWMGPLRQPDSTSYEAFASMILAGGDWAQAVDLHHANPATLRMIGYPVIIAASQALAGTGWAWLLAGFQSALGLLAALLILRAGRAATGSPALALIAAGCYVVSPALQLDLTVLTDALYAHLLAILTALLVLWHAEDRAPTLPRLLTAGALLAIALLIRSATMPLGLLFLVPVAVWVRTRGLIRGAGLLAVFVLPLLATNGAYQVWNKSRSGEAFLATDTRFALTQALVEVQSQGVPVFTGNTVLDTSARAVFAVQGNPVKDTVVPEMYAISNALIDGAHLSEVEATRLIKARFFEVVLAHPGTAVFGKLLREVTSKAMFTPFDPVRVLRRLLECRDIELFDAKHDFLKRPLAEWRPGDVVWTVLEGLSRLGALMLVAGFLAAAPMACRRALSGDGAAAFRLALVVITAGFIGAVALIHLEERYIFGMMPALLFAALPTLSELARRGSAGGAPQDAGALE